MKHIKHIYVEKRPGFDIEACALQADIAAFLGGRYPGLGCLKRLRLLNRYEVSGLDKAQFQRAVELVLSEPQCDTLSDSLPTGGVFFAVEYLPGQYDQRADSAEQCIELAVGVKPSVKTARVYIIEGNEAIDDEALAALKRYIINPVDSQECRALQSPEGAPLQNGEAEAPGAIEAVSLASPDEVIEKYGLAMSLEDLLCIRAYFQKEGREPTIAELRVLDTYWSDHCRHTTFNTGLEEIVIEGSSPEALALRHALEGYYRLREEVYGAAATSRPVTLMDMATIGAKALKKRGLLPDLDESPEINACTIKVETAFEDGSVQPWLLLFKNETHNHPTEIEPFGGAATCLGGAIRDPLSGRAYVHQALRISGAGDPRQSLADTLPGKLPQVKICREAAAGYSSYGNQIGLATGQVEEFYHPGFVAKRMELGAVIAAVPQGWVRREEPQPGDLVLLLGGKTGRDGIGGATGSSKAHTGESVEKSGAEVQKGNPVEERKLQRLFRNPKVTKLIKRCNDFGAGGVAVAVGELAPGLDICLDDLPRKYAGLDGLELAISESQERMAVVTAASDADALIAEAAAENLDATVIAEVNKDKRLRMKWRGQTIIDLSRDFLDTNGASRQAKAKMTAANADASINTAGLSVADLRACLQSLRCCSRRGLKERFDGSIGAASVLFPFGGSTQGTPECGMAALLPGSPDLGPCLTASIMTFGYNPELAASSPYRAAKGAIREALAKIACIGGDWKKARLSLQEYFPRAESPETWGLPAAALLGALEAQVEYGVPAIGGKDSMSGTYRDLQHGIDKAVPPTLVAFAAGVAPASSIRSGTLSGTSGNSIVLIEDFRDMPAEALAAYPLGPGGVAATLAVMAFGNMTGVALSRVPELGAAYQGAVLLELSADQAADCKGMLIGETLSRPVFILNGEETPLDCLRQAWEETLEQVYPVKSNEKRCSSSVWGGEFTGRTEFSGRTPVGVTFALKRHKKPLVLLPVFPGTNCEYDMERSFRSAGAEVQALVFRNRSREDIAESTAELAAAIRKGRILAISGGFSAGDEPDGSGKFIANVLRAPMIQDAVMDLLQKRDGLILGICNGFQALIKLGLLPYGEYREASAASPTLAGNRIGRHVSRMVRTRVLSNSSPWMALEERGREHVIPVSHGEGRLVISDEEAACLFNAGQVACVYGSTENSVSENPNGSAFDIEALTSPDGRVLGKMGHSERCGSSVHINIPGNKVQRLFESGVAYIS